MYPYFLHNRLDWHMYSFIMSLAENCHSPLVFRPFVRASISRKWVGYVSSIRWQSEDQSGYWGIYVRSWPWRDLQVMAWPWLVTVTHYDALTGSSNAQLNLARPGDGCHEEALQLQASNIKVLAFSQRFCVRILHTQYIHEDFIFRFSWSLKLSMYKVHVQTQSFGTFCASNHHCLRFAFPWMSIDHLYLVWYG